MTTIKIYKHNNRTGDSVKCTEVHSLAEFAEWMVSVHSDDDHYCTDKLGNLYEAAASEIDTDGNVLYGTPIVDHANPEARYWMGDHTYSAEPVPEPVPVPEPEPLPTTWWICERQVGDRDVAIIRELEDATEADASAWFRKNLDAWGVELDGRPGLGDVFTLDDAEYWLQEAEDGELDNYEWQVSK